jgi:hypothetical protein
MRALPIQSELVFCAAAAFLSAFAPGARAEFRLGIEPFGNMVPAKTEFDGFHLGVYEKLQIEGTREGVRPVLVADGDSTECEYYVRGTVDSSMQGYILILSLGDYARAQNESKVIPVGGKTREELLDFIALQIRYFLEHSLLSDVSISSIPLGCNVAVNGKKSGKTPLELLLKPGHYVLNISHSYFYPFTDSLFVTPRQKAAIRAEMKFRGANSGGWCAAAVVFSALAATAVIAEYRFHKDYLDVPRFRPDDNGYERTGQEEYNRKFLRYKNMTYARSGLLGISGISWSVTAVNFFRNKSIKKKLYSNELQSIRD